jgi:hypothetical protein
LAGHSPFDTLAASDGVSWDELIDRFLRLLGMGLLASPSLELDLLRFDFIFVIRFQTCAYMKG